MKRLILNPRRLRVGRVVPLRRSGLGQTALPVFAGCVLAAYAVFGDLTLGGDGVTLVLNDQGEIASLKETVSGRELIGKKMPFAAFVDEKRKTIAPIRMAAGDGRFTFFFPGDYGEVEIQATRFAGGWTFGIVRATAKDFHCFEICRVQPGCVKWKGLFVNAWSDERSAVCVRNYGIEGAPKSSPYLRNDIEGTFPLVGRRTGFAAGPREGFLARLRAMTEAAGVPQSDCGGAWSIGSEPARRSYVFARIKGGDVDYWIDLARRSGFIDLHFCTSWAQSLGDYPVHPSAFPDGLDEMVRACRRIREAGLGVGMHTLTGCIGFNSKWIRPVCDTNLFYDAVYTLAVPLTEGAKELIVEERPIDKHALVATYSSNGNYLTYNGEVMQYTGIRREKPYAFTGLTRGVIGTRKTTGVIPAGARIGYPHHRYRCFYPDPDGPLAEKIADRLAEVYNSCAMNELYFDGSEGMGSRYGIDAMRYRIFTKLDRCNGHSPSVEASCQGANNWWFQTRMATVDHPVFGMKRFHDWHLDWGVHQGRLCNFLEPQMGWWEPYLANERVRGHFPDEMEYFAGKNAGHDAAMSVQGLEARPLPLGTRRQLTILGWYERPRLARAFTDEVRGYLAGERTEGRLRQGADGVWRLSETSVDVHRAGRTETREWKVMSDSPRPVALRVEALYTVTETNAAPILAKEEFAGMEVKTAAKGVKAMCAPADGDAVHGRTFRFSAENGSELAPNAAWASVTRKFAFPGKDLGKGHGGFGVWVRGDGSGALLNFTISNIAEFGLAISEHYVRLDFTGWKWIDFLFRERDASERYRYVWPYGNAFYPTIYCNSVKTDHLGGVSVYLNDIPKGGRAEVEIGAILPRCQVAQTVTDAAVKVNGITIPLPFALESGEYAELDDGAWTKYSAHGLPLERRPVEALPAFRAGENELAFVAGAGQRAEVTAFAFGRNHAAFKTTDRAEMRFEAMEPFVYDPANGLKGLDRICVRPKARAGVSCEILGPAQGPRLRFGAESVELPSVDAGELFVCRDGANWKIVKAADGQVLREGKLARALPILEATCDFAFSAEVPSGAHAEIDLMKEY